MEKSRYESMQQLQETLRPQLEKLFVTNVPELNENITSLLERKLRGPSVRSYFTFWMYKYLAQCAKVEGCSFRLLDQEISEVHLPFVAEAVMSVMYLHNQVLDKKQKVTDISKISCNLLRGNLLKDRIYDYIHEQFKAKDEPQIQYYVRRIFRCVDVGHYFDKFHSSSTLLEGNHPTIFEDKSLTKIIDLTAIKDIIGEVQKDVKWRKDAIEIYFERNYLISAALFRYITELIITLTGYDGKEKNNVVQFAECYGFMMQLVNDINDFVKEKGTTYKESGDVLSDIKNGIITLPMLLHLEKKEESKLMTRFLQDPKAKTQKGIHNELLKELILSGALKSTMKAGRAIAERAQSFLSQRDNKSYSKLSGLLSIAFNNRYYYHIYQAKKFYKALENRSRLYQCEGNIAENSLNFMEEEMETEVYHHKQFLVIRFVKKRAKKIIIAAT